MISAAGSLRSTNTTTTSTSFRHPNGQVALLPLVLKVVILGDDVIWVRERFRAISNEIPWSRLLRSAFAGSHVNPVSMYSLLYIHPGIAASVSLYDGDGIRCSPRAERRMGMNAAMMAALQPADEAVRSTHLAHRLRMTRPVDVYTPNPRHAFADSRLHRITNHFLRILT